MTLRQLSARRGHRALLRHGEPAAEPGAVLERRADAGRGSCSPSPGHGRSAPRSAEVGFTAALDKGTNQDAATDQRALGDGRPIRKSATCHGALSQRRCIVPERKVVAGAKQPYAIARQDGQSMAFANLWESFCWPDEMMIRAFAIMTTTPNAEMSRCRNCTTVCR